MRARRVRDEGPVSFLSRLSGDRPPRELSEDERFARERLAIARNLAAVLNTKKGVGSVVADLGLGDYEGKREGDAIAPHFGVRSKKEMLPDLTAEIEQQVLCFEPRLKAPSVTFEEHLSELSVAALRPDGGRTVFEKHLSELSVAALGPDGGRTLSALRGPGAGRPSAPYAAFSIRGSLRGRRARFRIALHTKYRDVVVVDITSDIDEEA
ncbi:GPW/gp25 family protein [Sorangium sp. So ce1099]|uniref:GPW/gp25 family protein n=1 Tax=Sorangium sp. So ce1099 TaxID=3133331 RepID=UPI003F63A18F